MTKPFNPDTLNTDVTYVSRNGKVAFHIEQDRSYQDEQNSFTKKWANTKLVLLKTWTVYKYVGSPSYQTPIHQAACKADAKAYLASIGYEYPF